MRITANSARSNVSSGVASCAKKRKVLITLPLRRPTIPPRKNAVIRVNNSNVVIRNHRVNNVARKILNVRKVSRVHLKVVAKVVVRNLVRVRKVAVRSSVVAIARHQLAMRNRSNVSRRVAIVKVATSGVFPARLHGKADFAGALVRVKREPQSCSLVHSN